MLQIILFILKLIGWILLAILGLLVLVLLAALFVPLRYRVETSCKGKLSTLEAGVSFRILFRLVGGIVQYRDGKLSWNIRVAWIRLGEQAEAKEIEETVEDKIEEVGNDLEEAVDRNQEKIKKQPEETAEGKTEEQTERAEIEDNKSANQAEGSQDIKQTVSETNKTEKKSEEVKKADREKGKADNTNNGDIDKEEQNAKQSLSEKIAAVFEKIKYTFDKICDKIKILMEKAELMKAFLTDDVHRSAFFKFLTELKKMLIRLRPKRIEGRVCFGFEDPSLTGRVLAGASILYPYWGEHVSCWPDFENQILEGEVSVEGALRLLPAAVLAWKLLWNKNVRRTVMDIKRFISKLR